MRHPKDIGDRSTLAIMLALHTEGYAIFIPFGENTRYDLVIDEGARLSRVQCKTGRLINGSVVFRPCSTYAHHPNPKIRRRSYTGEIEYFAVYCPELGAVYLVPIDDVSAQSHANLRVTPVRNGQAKKIRLAAPYEIARIDLY